MLRILQRSGVVGPGFLGLVVVMALSPRWTRAGEPGPMPNSKPNPVVVAGLRFEAVADDPRGRVRAVDPATGRECWAVDVFEGGEKSAFWPWVGDKGILRIRELVPIGDKVGVIGGRSASALLDPITREVEPIRDDSRDPAEAECPVHHRPLQAGLAPIHYGIAARPSGLPASDAFPYARTVINAGCCVMPWKRAIVPLCPACVEAQAKAGRELSRSRK